MRRIKTNIIINATPAAIWEVLMNFSEYSHWNPFIPEISGTVKLHETLKVRIQPPGKNHMVFKPVVSTLVTHQEFAWTGKLGVKGIFDGNHYFKLERIDDTQTRLIHGENFSGMLVPLLWSTMEEATHQGFELMNNALKITAENLN